MKKMRKFKCKSGFVIERLVSDNQLNAKCNCGEMAVKTISAARYCSNTTGKSPCF